MIVGMSIDDYLRKMAGLPPLPKPGDPPPPPKPAAIGTTQSDGQPVGGNKTAAPAGDTPVPAEDIIPPGEATKIDNGGVNTEIPTKKIIPETPDLDKMKSDRVAGARGLTQNFVKSSLGQNYGKYEGDVNSMLDDFATTMPGSYGPDDVYGYYGNGSGQGQKIIDTLQGRYRDANKNAARSTFGSQRPYTDVQDTADDSLIASLIGEMKPLAQQQIEFARKRGTLNAVGENRANVNLGNKEKSVNAHLQGAGGSLLEAIRGKLGAIGTEANTSAAGSSIGDNFALDPYNTRYGDTLSSGMRDLEGNLRGNLTGDEFSIKDIIGRSGAEQGVINPGGADPGNSALLSTLEQNKRRKSQTRGLGTQGAF